MFLLRLVWILCVLQRLSQSSLVLWAVPHFLLHADPCCQSCCVGTVLLHNHSKRCCLFMFVLLLIIANTTITTYDVGLLFLVLSTPSSIERCVECLAASDALPHVFVWSDGAISAFTVHFAKLSVPTRLARRHFAVYAACTQCTSLFLHNPTTHEFYRSARFPDEVQTLLHLSTPNTYYNPTVCPLLYGVQRTLCNYRACVACPTVLGNSIPCISRFHIGHATVVE